MSAAAGYEVMQHADELRPIIRKIMAEHTARNGCGWWPDAEEQVLCDLAKSVEQQERCNAGVQRGSVQQLLPL